MVSRVRGRAGLLVSQVLLYASPQKHRGVVVFFLTHKNLALIVCKFMNASQIDSVLLVVTYLHKYRLRDHHGNKCFHSQPR